MLEGAWGRIGKSKMQMTCVGEDDDKSDGTLMLSDAPDGCRRRPVTASGLGDGLELASVLKASQTISGEIMIDKLVETLMVTAVQQAGAERDSSSSGGRRGTSGGGGDNAAGRHRRTSPRRGRWIVGF